MNTQTTEQALTHHVRLVLDNDEGLYLRRRELVREATQTADASRNEGEAADQTMNFAVSVLADDLKDFCEELCGLEDRPFDLGHEIMTTALAFVDWRDMARDYIAEEAE